MRGYASYIADHYAGHYTTSGAIYQPQGYTAAHNTLPFGTVVKVKNNHNGRTVNVTVNDRFPYYPNRIINLSRTAAEYIQLPYNQLGDVTVTAKTLASNPAPQAYYGPAPQAAYAPPPPAYYNTPQRTSYSAPPQAHYNTPPAHKKPVAKTYHAPPVTTYRAPTPTYRAPTPTYRKPTPTYRKPSAIPPAGSGISAPPAGLPPPPPGYR